MGLEIRKKICFNQGEPELGQRFLEEIEVEKVFGLRFYQAVCVFDVKKNFVSEKGRALGLILPFNFKSRVG